MKSKKIWSAPAKFVFVNKVPRKTHWSTPAVARAVVSLFMSAASKTGCSVKSRRKLLVLPRLTTSPNSNAKSAKSSSQKPSSLPLQRKSTWSVWTNPKSRTSFWRAFAIKTLRSKKSREICIYCARTSSTQSSWAEAINARFDWPTYQCQECTHKYDMIKATFMQKTWNPSLGRW